MSSLDSGRAYAYQFLKLFLHCVKGGHFMQV